MAAARLAGVEPPPLAEGLAARVEQACAELPAGRRLVRGYFSGGTLCYEAQVILAGLVGPVYSNEPLRPAYRACPRRRARTSASTSAPRSTPRAGRTR